MVQKLTLPPRLIDIHNHVAADDPLGERLIGLMDANNVEMTLVMGATGPGNAAMLAAVKAHGDRLVGGAYIDPRGGSAAIDQIARYHDEGICLIKLFPNLGYYPDDGRFVPFFDRIADLGMGVLSHCGWLTPTMGITAAYYSHPGRFEKVIRTYPETVFIMAHMGGIAGLLETVMLTTRTPNTYTDCSPGQGVWAIEHTGAIAGSVPADKMLWGVDCYHPEGLLDRQRAALEKLGYGPAAEKIFYSTARSIFEKIGAV